MKLILKQSLIKVIRKNIEKEKENVKNGLYDKYVAFDIVYHKTQLLNELKLLNKKELNILWNEMRAITQ